MRNVKDVSKEFLKKDHGPFFIHRLFKMRFSRRKQLRGTRRNRKNVVRTRKQQPVVRGRKTRKIRRTGGFIKKLIRRIFFGKSDSVAPLDASTLDTSEFFKDSIKKKSWINKYFSQTRLENYWDIYRDEFGDKNADELEKFFKKEKEEKDKTYENGKEDEILNTLLYVKIALIIDTVPDTTSDVDTFLNKNKDEIDKRLNEFLYKGKDVFKDKTRLNTYLSLDIPQSESLKDHLGYILYDLEKENSHHHADDTYNILSGIQEPAELSFKFINYMLFIIDQHLLNLWKGNTETSSNGSTKSTGSTGSETDSLK